MEWHGMAWYGMAWHGRFSFYDHFAKTVVTSSNTQTQFVLTHEYVLAMHGYNRKIANYKRLLDIAIKLVVPCMLWCSKITQLWTIIQILQVAKDCLHTLIHPLKWLLCSLFKRNLPNTIDKFIHLWHIAFITHAAAYWTQNRLMLLLHASLKVFWE